MLLPDIRSKASHSTFLFRIVLASAIKQEKEIKGIWIGKEAKANLELP